MHHPPSYTKIYILIFSFFALAAPLSQNIHQLYIYIDMYQNSETSNFNTDIKSIAPFVSTLLMQETTKISSKTVQEPFKSYVLDHSDPKILASQNRQKKNIFFVKESTKTIYVVERGEGVITLMNCQLLIIFLTPSFTA